MANLDLSKICQICLSEAPEKVKFYQHYGAICCYSCKAFFRRYIRGENNIHLYRCKENSNCPLTEGRKTCKKCRYDKCLQVGMIPEKVLNEEDRKKFTHAKKNKRKRTHEEAALDLEALETTSEEGETQANFDPTTLQFLIDEVQKTFLRSIMEVSAYQENVELLISGHLDKNQWSIYHTKAFMEIMDGYEILMRNFADRIQSFRLLPTSDQDLLLRNNGKFFREYMMSRYFMATNGLEQLDWILGLHDVLIQDLDIERIQLVNFDTVNQAAINGFLISHVDPSAIQTYKADLKVMRKYFLYPRFHTALVCYYMLFNTRQWSSDDLEALSDKDKILSMELQAKEMIIREVQTELEITYLDTLVNTMQALIQLKTRATYLALPLVKRKYCSEQQGNQIVDLRKIELYLEK